MTQSHVVLIFQKKGLTVIKKYFAIFLVLYLAIGQITSAYANEIENLPQAPVYGAAAVVLMDADTGLVLYGNEAHLQLYPASITKVMTALVVLEQAYDLQDRIEFSEHSVFSIPRNSSHIAMDVGETLTVEQALYALMLASANEVSLALAEHIAGSVEAFVSIMNRRAMSLGATNTYFVNPSGLPVEGHVTTAYDMALIMRAAAQHPDFVRIISARRFDIPPTERQPLVRELLNTNRLIQPGAFFHEDVIGGKTGWTTDAQHTLVTYAARDGQRLIVSVLRTESAGNFVDTVALLEYGFALPFEEVTIFDPTMYAQDIPVMQAINGSPTEIARVPILANRDITFNLPIGYDPAWLRYYVSIPETLSPPVRQGAQVGRVDVYVQNIRVGEILLLAQEEILRYTPSPAQPETQPTTTYQPANIYAQVYEYIESTELMLRELLLTFALPLAASTITLLITVTAMLSRKKRRMRRMLHYRYAKYPDYYRYR